MANPEIQLAWGGGVWKRCDRRVVRPVLESAIALTTDATDYLDLTFAVPKTCSSWRVARRDKFAGECIDVNNFDVHFPVDHIKHRKLGSQLVELTITTLHELTHAIRLEHFQGDDLIELAATEGLAYVSGDLLTDALFSKGEGHNARSYIDRRHAGQHDNIKSEFARLADLEARAVIDDDAVCEIFDEWFVGSGSGAPRALVFAVGEVNRRLDEGNQFADLMHWPAHELLDMNRTGL